MNSFDDDLSPVLALASNDDLAPLVGYIIKAKPTEALTNNDLYKKHSPTHTEYVNLIEKEIRKFGGNSVINLVRRNGPSYNKIVRDVADKLKANYNKHSSVEEVEEAILLRIVSDSWEKMSDEEKQAFLKEMGIGIVSSLPKALPLAIIQTAIKASGFIAYKLAVIVANAAAKAILGKGLSFAVNVTLTRSIALFAGPIGWFITVIWTLNDIAGPAYRVTIPCIVHIAMLRQQNYLLHCPECSAPHTSGAKFCQNCGKQLP